MDDNLRPRNPKFNSPSAPHAAPASGMLTPWSERLRLRRDPSPMEAPVEVVFMCDLPGFNGPWLTQYAHKVARRTGPVAILHVEAERIEIQRVSGSDPAHANASDGAPGDALANLTEAIREGRTTLEQALTALARNEPAVGHWIIQLPADRSRETRLVAREFFRWTLMCGGESLSIEDAAEVLRDLIDGDEHAASRCVSVALMGGSKDPARGENAIARISKLVDWPGELHLADECQQMAPVQTDWVGGFDWTPQEWPSVYRFMSRLAPLLHEWEQTPKTPAPTTNGTKSSQTSGSAAKGKSGPTASATTSAISVGPDDHEPIDLISFLNDPDCIALDARCPRDPQTAIAINGAGVIQLLRHEPGLDARAALADLMATAAWVAEHAQVLQLTMRSGKIDGKATPMLHLFGSDGPATAEWAGRFSSVARIHLLQPAPKTQAAWVHVALG